MMRIISHGPTKVGERIEALALEFRRASQIDFPLGVGAGELDGAGAPGNGKGRVGRLVGIVKIGPPLEFVGEGNGFGISGKPGGKGKPDVGSGGREGALAEAAG
jgi:hypothetical protein